LSSTGDFDKEVEKHELPPRIWTIGHSKLPSDELIQALKAYGIDLVADVRRFPNSRSNPQFNQDELARQLLASGIGYVHFPDLGGRRRPRPDSVNTVWKNRSFQGYADYMESADFKSAMGQLLDSGAGHKVALMCAEAVWWRCHRRLISDYLVALGIEVIHILSGPGSKRGSKPHVLTPGAKVVEGKVSYTE